MILLADKKLCTGCGACAFQCPRSCIKMESDTIGQIYPIIDTAFCIECHACEKICPVLNEPETYLPQRAYAAWSLDPQQRATSASGGIAYELYRYAVANAYKVVGASFNDDLSVSLKIASTCEEIMPFKNSKYVFSEPYSVYPQIREGLKRGEKFMLVGVSCQIAAMRKLFDKYENVIYVEILCHGMTPFSYLRQHVDAIENKTGKKSYSMTFRAPEAHTNTYTLILYDAEGNSFYVARTKDGDAYQYGYHRSVSYRENCYHCSFAKRERVGDIILCDFYGLGKTIPFEYDKNEVSCILTTTFKGKTFIDQVIASDRIFAEERPIEEAVDGNPRLRQSNRKTDDRREFESRIAQFDGDFEQAIAPLVASYIKALEMPFWKKRLYSLKNQILELISS